MDVVTLWKCKRPTGWCRWLAYELGSDSLGTWVFTPARSGFVRRDAAGTTATFEHWEDREGRGRPSLALLPHDGWYVGYWVFGGDDLLNVDITTPPQRSGSAWIFEDLELDPYLRRDGTFGVEDEDEFAAACEAGLITNEEQLAAERAVELMRPEVTRPTSALLAAGLDRIATAVALGLAPLPVDPDIELPLTRNG